MLSALARPPVCLAQRWIIRNGWS